jgi:hypothetical protein
MFYGLSCGFRDLLHESGQIQQLENKGENPEINNSNTNVATRFKDKFE